MRISWEKVFIFALVIAASQLLFQEMGVPGFSPLFVTEYNMDSAAAVTIQINESGPVPIYIAYPLSFLINFVVALMCTTALKLLADGIARLFGQGRTQEKSNIK